MARAKWRDPLAPHRTRDLFTTDITKAQKRATWLKPKFHKVEVKKAYKTFNNARKEGFRVWVQ